MLLLIIATAYDTVRNAGDFYQSGRAFGNFQRLLSGYPSETLFETIPGFHDTPARYKQFLKALQEDPCRRACGVQKEIDFVMKRASDMEPGDRDGPKRNTAASRYP
jgi:hypothetical protein